MLPPPRPVPWEHLAASDTCPACGVVAPDGALFCEQCGAALIVPAPAGHARGDAPAAHLTSQLVPPANLVAAQQLQPVPVTVQPTQAATQTVAAQPVSVLLTVPVAPAAPAPTAVAPVAVAPVHVTLGSPLPDPVATDPAPTSARRKPTRRRCSCHGRTFSDTRARPCSVCPSPENVGGPSFTCFMILLRRGRETGRGRAGLSWELPRRTERRLPGGAPGRAQDRTCSHRSARCAR